MSNIHLILTAKGGVGKSYISTLIAQYLAKDGNEVICADTDPSNATFSSYPAFRAKHIKIMTPEMNTDKSGFDELIDLLLSADSDCVVDNGSSSFLPMMAYLMENEVIPFLIQSGKNVVIHSVLIGGLGLDETQRGVDSLLRSQAAPLVVWENELYGPVQKNGLSFVQSKIYEANQDRILGIVNIKQRGEDTFGKDLKAMTTGRMTFEEAMAAPGCLTMARQRLVTVRRDIDVQLDRIDFTRA